ncbi:MAG: hypothetical protein OQK57_02955 [Ignavibacteriaceae bacterium]|nr:hypothetical protein [Ignavibacteriaceae bacterium]
MNYCHDIYVKKYFLSKAFLFISVISLTVTAQQFTPPEWSYKGNL